MSKPMKIAAGIAAALALTPNAALAADAGQAELTPAAIDSYVTEHLNSTGLPGVAISVVKDGKVVHTAGYGHDANGSAMTDRTPMSLASLSKSFTAMAVMRLAEDGKIRLEAPVAEQLPEFAPDDPRAARITVRDLLNQRSGISDTTADIPAVTRSASLAEAVAALRTAKLHSDPGSRYEYSNPNFVVAARLVEVASGEGFPAYLEKAVLQPLGMTGTSATGDLPKGHIDVFGVWVARPELPAFGIGAGRMVSNAADMARWLAAQQGGSPQVVSDGGLSTMHTPPTGSDYAMGWSMRQEGDQTRIEHGGNLFTATGSMVLLPKSGYGFAVLSNSAGLNDDAYPIIDGLVALSEGRAPESGTPTLRIIDAVLAGLAVLAIVLGVLGFRRSRRWAQRRAGRASWRVAVRMLPVLIPALLLAAYLPMVEFLLGGRTVTWGQLVYSSPALLVTLLVAAAAGLVTAVRRIRAVTLPE